MRNPGAEAGNTSIDLIEHRASAINACLRAGVDPVSREMYPSEPFQVEQAKALVAGCQVFVAIVGHRYGYVPEGQAKSLTEIEYETAIELGLPCIVYIMSEDNPAPAADIETGPDADKLQSFKARVVKDGLIQTFGSATELGAKMTAAVAAILEESNRKAHRPSAFLLVPHADTYAPLAAFLSSELEREGVRVLRTESALGPGWTNSAMDAIRRSDFVVANVTGANPSVMYELGYAHALRKRTIMLADADLYRTVPDDLNGYLFLIYDKDDLGSLSKPLGHYLRAYSKEARG